MTRIFLIAFLALTIGGCGINKVTHHVDSGEPIVPALRYAKYHDGSSRYEDISDGNPDFADEIINTPVANGPMKIDCTNVREIGIIIRHGGAWSHDYDYVVTWPDSVTTVPKHFTFENRMTHGYRRGSARFRESLFESLLTLSVTHRNQKIYSTEFELVACGE